MKIQSVRRGTQRPQEEILVTRSAKAILLLAVATLCMGGTCTRDIARSAADTFVTSLAQTAAESFANGLNSTPAGP